MNPKLTNKLFQEFPNLYADRILPTSESLMSYGFCADDGWFKIIYNLSKKLENFIIKYQLKYPDKPAPRAFQIKEKLGGLRFYMNDRMLLSKRMRNAISKAESESYRTCERCGIKFTTKTKAIRGWIFTLCLFHRTTLKIRRFFRDIKYKLSI